MPNIFRRSNKWSWHNCRIISYQHIIWIQKEQKVFLWLWAKYVLLILETDNHLIQEKFWWHFFCYWMSSRIDKFSQTWCFKLKWLLIRFQLNFIYKGLTEVIYTLFKIFHIFTLNTNSFVQCGTYTFDRNHYGENITHKVVKTYFLYIFIDNLDTWGWYSINFLIILYNCSASTKIPNNVVISKEVEKCKD